jgi:hypothetical protein
MISVTNNLCVVSFKIEISEHLKPYVAIAFFLYERNIEFKHFHLLTFIELCLFFSNEELR